MRFLMLNWRDPRNPLAGGAERATLGYLSALVKRGHEVFWYANDFPGAETNESIDGIHIVRGGGRGVSIFKALLWYRKQKPFDLVIDQHHGIAWFAPWWCHTNCIAYIHEVLGPIWDSFYPWPISALGRWQERWTHWLYRNIPFWTVSLSTRTSLQTRGVKDITVIPNGINTVALTALEAKPLDLPLRLVAVSRLAPNKRVDHVIRTMKCLTDQRIDARLIIVGTGDVEKELRQLVDELQLAQKVSFTGKLSEEEKDKQLRQAHVLLHASVREGWGLNVIEANALGTPAVVYPVAGLVDSTLQNETGLVAEAETPEALAVCLTSLLKEPEQYQRLRSKAWERAKALHWDKVLPAACEWLEGKARQRSQASA